MVIIFKRCIARTMLAAFVLPLVFAVYASAAGTGADVNITSVSVISGTLTPGASTTMLVRLSNSGDSDADVDVALNVPASMAAGESSPSTPLNIPSGSYRDVYYDVRLGAGFSGSSISVAVKIDYESDGVPVSKEYPQVLMVSTPEPPAALPPATGPDLAFINATALLQAGKSGSISIEVTNNGDSLARNLRAVLTPNAGLEDVWDANETTDFTQSISLIYPSTSGSNSNRYVLTYNLNIPSGIKTGSYSFTVSGSYTEQNTGHVKTFREDIPVFVQNSFTPAAMRILDVGPIIPVNPGDQFSVTIKVQNTGGLDAQNAVIAITNLSGEGFSLTGSGALGIIGPVGAGQTAQCSLTLRAAPGMSPGAYPLNIRLTYSDADGTEQSPVTTEVFIEVPYVPAASLEVVRATVPGGTLRPGQTTAITVELRNPSQAEAKDVKVKVTGFSGTGLYLTEGEGNLPTKTIDSIPAGGIATVSYNVKLSGIYDSGSIALQAEVSAADVDMFNEALSFAVLLPPAESPSPSQSSTPKLIISNYSMAIDGETLLTLSAGAVFDLTFTLRNTSARTDLQNITVTLISADGIFLPASGSNTFYIDSVPIGGEVERTIRMVVSQSAETKSYPLSFNLDYEDTDGAGYRPTETLSLPVAVPLVVELSNFNPPTWGDVGMQSYLSFQYINKGKSTAYNFTISIEGDFMLPDGASTYIGNLSSGYADYFECSLIPTMGGDNTGAVVLTFEDAIGNVKEVREEFSLYVNESVQQGPGDFPMFPDNSSPSVSPPGGGGWFGLSWWAIGGIGAGVIIVAAVTVLLVRRHRKLRKNRDADDDDDGEDDEG